MIADENADPPQSPTAPAPGYADDEVYEERMAARWRRAIIRLSEKFIYAADERSDLSPILLEAMHNALNNLLVYGEAGDLMALEDWLNVEDDGAPSLDDTSRALVSRSRDRRGYDRRMLGLPVSHERRQQPRRADERRAVRDWHFEAIPLF